VWGSGNAKLEFLHVNDMVKACVHHIELDRAVYGKNTEAMVLHISIGFGGDVNIEELADTLKNVVGFKGQVEFNTSKPDGPPRKC
jgi:GDP-L-fucose synthase